MTRAPLIYSPEPRTATSRVRDEGFGPGVGRRRWRPDPSDAFPSEPGDLSRHARSRSLFWTGPSPRLLTRTPRGLSGDDNRQSGYPSLWVPLALRGTPLPGQGADGQSPPGHRVVPPIPPQCILTVSSLGLEDRSRPFVGGVADGSGDSDLLALSVLSQLASGVGASALAQQKSRVPLPRLS